uniref:Aspartyl/asparaginy/proline hydroxylase domain-containing protein n=1 Tax=Chrysotila carterae TaxID=13221 RepID=A0A7S4BQD6_CHRCT
MEHACAIAAASYASRSSWRPRCGCAVSACKTTFSGDVTKKSSQLKEAEAASSQSGVQPNTTAAASPLKGQIGTSPITPAAAVVSTASDTTAPATASVTQSEVAAEASTTKARTEATVSEPAPPESVPNVTAVASLTKISARSSLVERFSPWLSELRQQLKEIAEDMVRRIGAGERGDDEEDDDGSCGGEKDSMSAEEVVSRTRELAFRLGSLLKLLMEEVLPRMPDDAEVLFLIASADFLAHRFGSAVHHAQQSLMASQRVPDTELAQRHYFLACCIIRTLEPSPGLDEARRAAGEVAPSAQRRTGLLELLKASLLGAIKLGDTGFISPYIDIDYYARLAHGDDLRAIAATSRSLAAAAVATNNYWRSNLQRPSHFLRSLRSQPFYDAGELEWAPDLLAIFSEIKAEVEQMRQPTRGAERNAWDSVGSKHDEGDRHLAQGGAWTELVLLNSDVKVAASARSNRKRCPKTSSFLNNLEAAADLARRGIGECTFSSLAPGTHLQPHCGGSNVRITCHLPLIVPEGCSIRVGDEVRTYREGELLVFDDSFEHEVWNKHPTKHRVVLLIRLWHPDIRPKQYAHMERQMKRQLRDHRRRTAMPPL